MGSDAHVRSPVHVVGANLDFDALVLRPDHSRVERLIHVALWQSDIVLEAARDRRPTRMDNAQRSVAVAQALYYDAKRDQIVDALELDLLLAHLAVDREGVL